jgi:Ca2+:H+ antiporter
MGNFYYWSVSKLVALFADCRGGINFQCAFFCSSCRGDSHCISEPFGTLLLALAITIIEVSMIVILMLAGGPETSVLASDTVFAAVMIILNGMVGLSILAGGIKFKEQNFTLQGISAALTILAAIASLTLILPNYTTSVPIPYYSSP